MKESWKYPLVNVRWGPGFVDFGEAGRGMRWAIVVPKDRLNLSGPPILHGIGISEARRAVIVIRFTRVDAGAVEKAAAISPAMVRRLGTLHRNILTEIRERRNHPDTPPLLRERYAAIQAALHEKPMVAIALRVLLSRWPPENAPGMEPSRKAISPAELLFPADYKIITPLREIEQGILVPQTVLRGYIGIPRPSHPDPSQYPFILGYDQSSLPVVVKMGSVDQARHMAVLGSTGSGKTVFSLCLVHQALDLGMRVVVMDVKGEMVKWVETEKGRRPVAIFGMDVISLADQNSALLWSYSSGLELDRRMREMGWPWEDDRDGKLDSAVREAVKSVHDHLIGDVERLSDLINTVILRRRAVEPAKLAERIFRDVRSDPEVPRLVRRLAERGEINPVRLGMMFHYYAIRHLRELMPADDYAAVLAPNAPYRHLICPAPGQPVFRFGEGGTVVDFGSYSAMVGKAADEHIDVLYTYVVNIILQQIFYRNRSAGENRERWLMYAEEAHRLPRVVLETLARTMRSFGVSLLIVTQNKDDIMGPPAARTTVILDQMTAGIAHMIASRRDIQEIVEAMGGEFEIPDAAISRERYGELTYLSRAGGKPALPVLVRVRADRVLNEIARIREAGEKRREEL